MFEGDYTIHLEDLIWSSDWNGDEVGYDDVEVVGLYIEDVEHDDYSVAICYYIDISCNKILEKWVQIEEL